MMIRDDNGLKFNEGLRKIMSRLGITDPTPPVAAAPPAPSCPTCGGTGFVRRDVHVSHPGFGKLHPCPNPECSTAQERREAIRGRLLKRSGLPERYAALTFESWYALPSQLRAGKDTAAAACWQFANAPGVAFSLQDSSALIGRASGDVEPRCWLVLQGALGVGKTGLAAAICNELLNRGTAALYYRTADMFAEIQSRYGRADEGGPSADELLETIRTAPVLILDEMNVPAASQDKQRIVEEIIRYRHGRDLPTVITCNIDPKGFVNMWGERAADVVLEQAHWLIVGGPRIRANAHIARED